MQGKPAKLIYVVSEDWFFASHFLPMARMAVSLGYDVAVATNVAAHGAAIAKTGARILPIDSFRTRRGLLARRATIRTLTDLFRREQPDIVHLIALETIVLGAIAARAAGVRKRVYALTGRGVLGAAKGWRARLTMLGIGASIRFRLDTAETQYVFENAEDAATFAPPAARQRCTVIGGAGIDPAAFAVHPEPASPPIRVALVARMLWQKGIDLAVDAVQRARLHNSAIELALYGAPDASNPRAIPEAQLREWSALPGIAWHGHSPDIAGVWAEAHICCLPSRGGEGLPRSLLEAAACGRAIVTTDVPGCNAFVHDGVEGRVVAPNDAGSLARAILDLASDGKKRERMGAAARARVLDGFTEEAVAGQIAKIYRDLLDEPGNSSYSIRETS